MRLLAKTAGKNAFDSLIVKLGNIESLEYIDQAAEGALSFMAGKDEYFVPMDGHVDVEAEKARIDKELAYLRGFLQSCSRY